MSNLELTLIIVLVLVIWQYCVLALRYNRIVDAIDRQHALLMQGLKSAALAVKAHKIRKEFDDEYTEFTTDEIEEEREEYNLDEEANHITIDVRELPEEVAKTLNKGKNDE